MTSGIVDGRFEIERLAGHGGMGVVYRARDHRDGGYVALKVLAARSIVNVERFHLEAEVLSGLSHPGIVRYIAHGVAESGEPYLAMEWLEGCDLQERLRTAPLGFVESLSVLRQAAEALAVAHARGLVHRDVKPSNLFLLGGQVDQVKLLDFGVARAGAGRALTGTGGVIGTLCYMAPEQARGSTHIDARADVFSLGGLVFECLTGHPPFHGDTPLEVLTHILFDDPPRLSQSLTDVPPGIDNLVARLLAADPNARPANAGEVARAVADLIIPPGFDKVAPRAPVRESLGVAEQRVVTVVLVGDADLPPISSNELLANLSTTDWIAHTQDLAAERARRPLIELLWNAKSHGARTERLLDGSLVVTLQGAEAATDQAARAARWALSLRRLLPGTAIALSTGRGLISRGAPREGGTVADVAANAAKLLAGDGSGRGAVRVDALTAELLAERFALRVIEPGVHDLLGERQSSGVGRRLLGRATPCVGREREIAMLSSVLDEVRAEPVARVALVTGPPGIGKSRLRHELLRRAGDRKTTEIWTAAGNPMSQGSAFALIAQLIRGASLIVDGQPLEVRRSALVKRVGRHLPPEAAHEVAEMLGEICGTPFLEEGSALLRALKQDPRLLGARMRACFARWLAAETAERLILIVIEDLQWGDLPTVKFIDEALAELHDRPLMVLALARPDVHRVFPRLWSERSLFELRLPELGKRASESLVRDALGKAVAEDTVKRVVARAEGNAFFLEELIRAVAEGRGEALPETVLGMLQQRLEAFPPSTRRVIRAASVYGDVFWRGGLNPLLGEDMLSGNVGDALEQLIDREVFEVRTRSRFPGQEELRFRHGLVREAAYAMLTDDDRALGHRLAGAWLERAGESDALVLAEHFERGGETERAIALWARAAKEALEGHDDEAALARAERGIACGATGEVRGLLRQIQASAHYIFRHKGEDAERFALEAVELLPPWSDAWCLAAQVVIIVSGSLGHLDHFFRVARLTVETEWQGEPNGAQIQLAAVVGLAHVLLGIRDPAQVLWDRVERAAAAGAGERDALAATRIAFVRAGRAGYFDLDLWAHIEHLREALEHARRLGDPVLMAWLLMSLGVAWKSVGARDETSEAFREALALAGKVGLEPEALAAQSALHRLAVLDDAGRARGAELVAAQREIRDELRKRREPYYRVNSQLWLAEMLADLGDREGALRESETAVDEAFSPVVRAVALALRARLLLDSGDVAAAFDAARGARQCWEIAPSPHALLPVAMVWPEALAAHGDIDESRKAEEESRALLRRSASRIPAGRLRDEFVRSCAGRVEPAA